jgi:cation diffusion facilitator family transporter
MTASAVPTIPRLPTGGGRDMRYRDMRRTLLVVLAVDLVLAVAKGGGGLLTGSLGMQADGLHSLLHVLGAIVGLVGISLASRPADASHPYGYERYEPLAAVGLVGFMLLAIYEILTETWARLSAGTNVDVGPWSLVLMLLATGVTLGLALWERQRGRRLGSTVLTTDGRRALADVLVSLTVVAGLVAARLGFGLPDILVSLGIAGIIGWTGWTSLLELSAILTDAAIADLDQIAQVAASVEGVRGVHRVRARGMAGMVRVDLHVSVDPAMPTREAHELTHQVVRRVQAEVGGIAEVLVHVGVHPEPKHGDDEHRVGMDPSDAPL